MLRLLSLPSSAPNLRLRSRLLLSLPTAAPGLRGSLLAHLKLRLRPRCLLAHLSRRAPAAIAAAPAISATTSSVTMSAAAVTPPLCVRGAVRTS